MPFLFLPSFLSLPIRTTAPPTRNETKQNRCVIYFYLEDESIHVAEPKQQNSGIPQGVFLKRHRIPKDDGASYFTITDINVGITATFYGRTFFIISCDPFTRKFLTQSGFEVPEDTGFPDEPIESYRASLKRGTNPYPPLPREDDLTRFVEARLGKASNALNADKLKKFLDNDRKVLRFFCVWDDREALYGDRRPYVMHYYLSDDTMEVLEVNEPNSGRDPFPVFLRRGPLPNQKLEVDALGPTKTYTHYTYADLKVGGHIKVYNRDFLIHAADNFTKAWYVENMGCSEADFEPLTINEAEMPIPQMALPPYNGFGGHADSLQNCIALIPKPVKPDFNKQMNYAHTIMRFKTKMVEDDSHVLTMADMDREFILSYYLANDTIGIFEPPSRNSGVVGGKFLERQEILKPNSAEKYEATDLFVGATLTVFTRKFQLVEADGYTYNFMEQHPASFPRSDFDQVISRVKALGSDKEESLRTAFIEMDVDGSGYLNEAELEAALAKAGIEVVKQEVITIVRKYDTNGDGRISIEEFFEVFNFKFEN